MLYLTFETSGKDVILKGRWKRGRKLRGQEKEFKVNKKFIIEFTLNKRDS